MHAWMLVSATLVAGGGTSHVEVDAVTFPTLNACQVKLLDMEHWSAAQNINKNWYPLKCIEVK
jgi:hypothetical protein